MGNLDDFSVHIYGITYKGYNEHRILPNGFIDSPIGSGHLNANGHRMIAELLGPILAQEVSR